MTGSEFTPLNDRLAVYQVGRSLLAVGVGAAAAIAPQRFAVPAPWIIVVAASYVSATTTFEVLRRRLHRRAIAVVTTGALIDAGLLATTVAVSGGLSSPFVLVCLLHLAVTALLVSYRTGLKASVAYALAVPSGVEAAKAGWYGTPELVAPFSPAMVASGYLVFAICIAVSSSFNERALRDSRRDYELRAHFGVLLHQQTDPAELVAILARFVKDSFGFDRVEALRRAGGRMQGVVVDGHGEAEISVDAELTEQRTGPELRLPLLADGLVVGWLVATWPQGTRGRRPRLVSETVEELVAHAALVLRHAELHAQVEHLAGHDSLTGLLNRRVALERMEAELRRARRSGEQVGLVFLDLDRFKSVNDSLGHEAGDDVLRAVGGVLSNAVRGHDLAARLGGEEFIVMLTDTDSERTIAATERIRRSIREASGGRVTASAGVALGPDGATELAALMRLADAALYNAKRAGRDRTCVAEPHSDVGAGVGSPP